ncbi:hypothetical protein BH10BAC5_BH10BAC5_03630 [soil metagenome]
MHKLKITALTAVIALVLINPISSALTGELIAKPKNENPLTYTESGVASWYGPGFQGRKTASGERFDTHEMTAAHKTLPFGTMLKVTNLENGISVVVKINDRGPFVRGRIIDLSNAAKNELQMGGTASVKIEIYNPDEETLTEESESENTGNDEMGIFETSLQVSSKVFLESQQSTEAFEKQGLTEIFKNLRTVRIKVLGSEVKSSNPSLYKEIESKEKINIFDVTDKVKFLKGFVIKVGTFTNIDEAEQLIGKLESETFANIFLEELYEKDSTEFNVFVGSYDKKDNAYTDLYKIFDMKYHPRIVNLGI